MSSAKGSPAARKAIEDVCAAGARALETGDVDGLEPRTVQQLVATAIKLYMAKREGGCEFNPVGEGDLTATDVSVTASGLLQAVRLEPFELTLWAKFGRI